MLGGNALLCYKLVMQEPARKQRTSRAQSYTLVSISGDVVKLDDIAPNGAIGAISPNQPPVSRRPSQPYVTVPDDILTSRTLSVGGAGQSIRVSTSLGSGGHGGGGVDSNFINNTSGHGAD